MGVYSRNGKLWLNFTYQGIRCFESLKLNDTKQNRKYAERLLAEIKNKIALDTFNYAEYFPESKKLKLFGIKPNIKVKFNSFALKWLKEQEDKNTAGMLKFSTLKSYKIGVEKLKLSTFWDKYFNQITIGEINEYIINLKKNLSAKSVNNMLIPLRQIFEKAYNERIIESNLMDRIKNLKIEKPEIEPFTKDEIIRILEYFNRHYPKMYCFIAVLVYTGMRVGEALAMKWENLDFNNWTYHIKENRVEGRLTTPKTKESKRIIKIITPLQAIIENHKKYTYMKSKFMFLNYYGKPYHKSTHIIKNYWKPALKELGIRYRDLRQLRHTHAILSLIAGDNPHDVAKRLGHTSLQMLFNRYAKFLKTRKDESKLEDLLNENSNKIVTFPLHYKNQTP